MNPLQMAESVLVIVSESSGALMALMYVNVSALFRNGTTTNTTRRI